jgi:hypothetical protein
LRSQMVQFFEFRILRKRTLPRKDP